MLRLRARFPVGLARPLSGLDVRQVPRPHLSALYEGAEGLTPHALPSGSAWVRPPHAVAPLAFPEPGCVAVRLLQRPAASTSRRNPNRRRDPPWRPRPDRSPTIPTNRDFFCFQWVNNPTLTEFCFGMIGRADIEGSKSNVAMNAWLPQASSLLPGRRGGGGEAAATRVCAPLLHPAPPVATTLYFSALCWRVR